MKLLTNVFFDETCNAWVAEWGYKDWPFRDWEKACFATKKEAAQHIKEIAG